MKLYSDHILIGSAFQSGTLEFDGRFSNFTPGMKPSSVQNTGSGCTEEDGRPGARGKGAEDILDYSGFYIIPGLVDIHTHAAMGADASDGDDVEMQTMSRFYAQNGVTSWCPTTMTLKEPELKEACRTISHFRRPDRKMARAPSAFIWRGRLSVWRSAARKTRKTFMFRMWRCSNGLTRQRAERSAW